MAKEILIADPDKTSQEDFQRIFETTDYHLVFSESGEDALLRARIFKPDLIIAGTALGEKNGLELCEIIKKDPEFRHIPFILVSNLFEEILEEDRERVQADGVISKPLHESEVLNLVRLLAEEVVRGKVEGTVKDSGEWKSFADLKQPEEEEIIELVDVVEEPESGINIDDFIAEEEIIRSERWKKLEEEETKTLEKEFAFPSEEKETPTKEMNLPLEKEVAQKEAPSEEELFERIELEEILKKVEELKPSIEKEWPEEVERRSAESTEKLSFEEFVVTPSKEAGVEPIKEEIRPFFLEESEKEIPIETAPAEMMVQEEDLEELSEEEFPEAFLEEILGEEEVGTVEEAKEIRPEAIKIETIEEEKTPKVWEERVTPIEKMVDKHLEEVIAKGIQEMVGDFITKLLPEMTQHIMGLTVGRIEKMVKEIVPDLAEKAIQEEIKRLQQGEKS